MYFSDIFDALNGLLAGMGSEVLLAVHFVTAVEDTDARVILFGIGELHLIVG